jgi:hypothetical protein
METVDKQKVVDNQGTSLNCFGKLSWAMRLSTPIRKKYSTDMQSWTDITRVADILNADL